MQGVAETSADKAALKTLRDLAVAAYAININLRHETPGGRGEGNGSGVVEIVSISRKRTTYSTMSGIETTRVASLIEVSHSCTGSDRIQTSYCGHRYNGYYAHIYISRRRITATIHTG